MHFPDAHTRYITATRKGISCKGDESWNKFSVALVQRMPQKARRRFKSTAQSVASAVEISRNEEFPETIIMTSNDVVTLVLDRLPSLPFLMPPIYPYFTTRPHHGRQAMYDAKKPPP